MSSPIQTQAGAVDERTKGLRTKLDSNISHPTGTKPWTNGLFDCFKPWDLCCLGLWCPCILYGKTHHRLQEGDMTTYTPVNSHCAICCLGMATCPLVPWVLGALHVQDVREKHDIKGDLVMDSFKACFCLPCALCQAEKEFVAQEPPKSVVDEQYEGEMMSMSDPVKR